MKASIKNVPISIVAAVWNAPRSQIFEAKILLQDRTIAIYHLKLSLSLESKEKKVVTNTPWRNKYDGII